MRSSIPIVYVYPGARYGGDCSRHTELMGAIAERHEVVFVETADDARPRVSVRTGKDGDVAIIEQAFRWSQHRVGRRLRPIAEAMDARAFQHALASIGVLDYVLWLATPAPSIIRMARTNRVVYDCIDPCLDPARTHEFDRDEASVTHHARLVFATARSLAERMRNQHDDVVLLPNAAPRTQGRDRQPVPAALTGRPRPYVGYMGTVDARVDIDLLFSSAAALPTFTFCIVGRINSEQGGDMERLAELPNVLMTGPVGLAEGDAYADAFDIALIPFQEGQIGDAINPVKMFMHLNKGTPVVASRIREAEDLRGYVASAASGEFARVIERFAAPDPDADERRRAYAADNTWAHRAEMALAELQRTGLTVGGPFDARPSSNGHA